MPRICTTISDNFLCIHLLRYKIAYTVHSIYLYSCIIHICLSFSICSEIRILSAVWHHALRTSVAATF